MTRKVFLGGSRNGIVGTDFPPDVETTLEAIVSNADEVLVGDAAGADTMFQKFFAERGYPHVTVFYSGDEPRHLLDDGWRVEGIDTDSGLTGRDLMELKDAEMASHADVGLMMWDELYKTRFGKTAVSQGTLKNILNLLVQLKPVLVFHVPTGQLMRFNSVAEFESFIDDLGKKHSQQGLSDNQAKVNTALKKGLKTARERFAPPQDTRAEGTCETQDGEGDLQLELDLGTGR